MTAAATRLVCHGCGAVVPPEEPLVFRCPAAAAEDDVDHVLEVDVDLSGVSFPRSEAVTPFVRFRELLYVARAARATGASDARVVEVFSRLDEAVAAIDGRGFRETPYGPLAGLVSLPGLWVKNEAVDVSGSHKARHLFGVAAHLELAGVPRERPLAIASCGNAALAAAVVARASGRPLRVFVPDDAPSSVVGRLRALGADVTHVGRPRPDASVGAGDPCIAAFRAAVAAGALPFSVQGPENGLVIEGARTIAWEMIAAHRRDETPPPAHVVVQVGGGALLSALVSAFEVAAALGVVDRSPVFHAVQTTGGAPLVAAVEALREDGAALADAARHRSRYMRPWPVPPRSVARGILDDETYDWLVCARGVTGTGGEVVRLDDDAIEGATETARAVVEPDVCETGAVGLAGALALAERGVIEPGERVDVVFTGARR